jgi:hypothetical protein
MLSPLFRYSDWRDAWILRLIGGRFGPVLVRAVPKADWSERERSAIRPQPAQPRESIRERLSRMLPRGGSALLAVSAVIVLLAAAIGFTVARRANHGGSSTALDHHASAGLLALSFPSGWRRRSSTSPSPLGLGDEIVVAPSASSDEMLLVGRTATADPQLLPQALLASLPSVPAPQTVVLGGTRLYRYLNLTPRGQPTEAVYAISTTVGTVLGVCVAPAVRIRFIHSCERSLGTLALASGKVLPPGPIQSYASTLNLTITQLNSVRANVGSRLRRATAGEAQADAAYALAAAHTRAASTLARMNAGPASAVNAAVVTALQRTGTAYLALGQAASRQSPTHYRNASASLRRASSALTVAYARLDVFGYRVS